FELQVGGTLLVFGICRRCRRRFPPRRGRPCFSFGALVAATRSTPRRAGRRIAVLRFLPGVIAAAVIAGTGLTFFAGLVSLGSGAIGRTGALRLIGLAVGTSGAVVR